MVNIKPTAVVNNKTLSLKPNILLIDDDIEVLTVLTLVLKAQGANVMPFNKSEEAIAYFENSPEEFDLVICDLVMKPLNGIATLEQIVKAKFSDTLVYLMSANATEAELNKAKELNIDGFVEKPMVHEQLASVLGTISYNKSKLSDRVYASSCM
jgi:CheY-like chemotaxis protein